MFNCIDHLWAIQRSDLMRCPVTHLVDEHQVLLLWRLMSNVSWAKISARVPYSVMSVLTSRLMKRQMNGS